MPPVDIVLFGNGRSMQVMSGGTNTIDSGTHAATLYGTVLRDYIAPLAVSALHLVVEADLVAG